MTSQTQQRGAERRRSPRQKSFLRGVVYFNHRRSAVDCLVRDISDHGARLIFSDPVTTPDAVELHIVQKEQTLRVNVMWRHGEELGVAFAQAAELNPAAETGDLAERVARLEVEIAGLKRILKKMKADAGPEFEVA